MALLYTTALAQEQQQASPLFNRKEELKALTGVLSARPDNVTVLTGPSNTGKTVLLQELARRLSAPADGSGMRQVVLMVDCRMGDTTSPSGFAAQLAASIESNNVGLGAGVSVLEDMLQQGLRVQGGVAGFSLQVSTSPQSVDLSPLSVVIESLKTWLMTCKGPPYPVIVIDEANKLRDWKNERARQVLLDFLVAVTKQQRLCHVVLSTADSGLTFWLQHRGIRPGHFRRIEVGDLPEDDMKNYVYGRGGDEGEWPGQVHLAKVDPSQEEGFTLPTGLWQEAYELLGGNIHQWQRAINWAAIYFRIHNMQDLEACWQQVFAEERDEAERFVKHPFRPSILPPLGDERPCWSPKQYGEVLQMIADAPEPHVVPYTEACDKIGEGALQSLLSYNYLTLRTRSTFARDLPPEAFVGEKDVVTATHQAALNYIMTKAWQRWVPARSSNDHRSSPSRSFSPTSDALRAVADEIRAVQDKIDEVEGQIKVASDEVICILAAKDEGWQVELTYWQQEERQLVEERRQLHEKKKLLREKELMLIKRKK